VFPGCWHRLALRLATAEASTPARVMIVRFCELYKSYGVAVREPPARHAACKASCFLFFLEVPGAEVPCMVPRGAAPNRRLWDSVHFFLFLRY
jgi:hypothetical protein